MRKTGFLKEGLVVFAFYMRKNFCIPLYRERLPKLKFAINT